MLSIAVLDVCAVFKDGVYLLNSVYFSQSAAFQGLGLVSRYLVLISLCMSCLFFYFFFLSN